MQYRIVSQLCVLCLLFAGRCDCSVTAQEAGIPAEIRDAEGNSLVQVQDTVALVRPVGWLIDRQLSAGEVSVTWSGLLLIQSPGEYQFSTQLNGTCAVSVADQIAISTRSDESKWIESKPIELQPGLVPLKVTYRSNSPTDAALLRLFWSGPGFELTEPVGGKYLFHPPRDDDDSQPDDSQPDDSQPDDSQPDDFQQVGAGALVQSYRCNACHAFDGRPVLAAPALDSLSPTTIRLPWLVKWLSAKSGSNRYCPTYGLDHGQAMSVAAYLLADRTKGTAAGTEKTDVSTGGNAQRGEVLFLSVGCLACHVVQSGAEGDSLGSSSVWGGGDLTHIAAKRPAEFFTRWLANPAQLNVDHRMPVFEMSADERADLSEYLSSLGQAGEPGVLNGNVAAGARLVGQSQCAACHRLPRQDDTKRIHISSWQSPCSASGPRKAGQPTYVIPHDEQETIRAYIERTQRTSVSHGSIPTSSTASELIEENNCLACHSRGSGQIVHGIGPTATEVVKKNIELAAAFASLVPPPLHQIGDKLTDEGLQAAISGSATPLRPWVRVRMPRFRLTNSEVQLLVTYFSTHDRLPDAANAQTNRLVTKQPPKSVSPRVGARLVGSDGFNCASCHGVGEYQPANAPLNARGPNLSAVAGRVRPAWFTRWVRNPIRIVPNVEMPSISTPVPGVLDDRLNDQIAAVWQAIKDPRFVIAQLQPYRVLRHSGSQFDARTIVLTDFLRLRHENNRSETFLKPFAVGLSNRHNVLFDMDACQLRGWWLGDLAAQMNDGKVWYWQANVDNLLDVREKSIGIESGADIEAGADIALVTRDGRDVPLERVGQFVTRPDAWKHNSTGVELRFRLHFSAASAGVANQTLRVRQTIITLPTMNGFRRQLQFENIPPDRRVRCRPVPFALPHLEFSPDRREVSIAQATTNVRIVDNQHRFADDGTVLVAANSNTSTASLLLEYTTDLEADRVPIATAEPSSVKATPLHVVPGFDALRLPIAEPFMPTGLAWDATGILYVTSLDGRVWRVRDSDGDGLVDAANLFSDELSTPYGVAVANGNVDVIDKTALLRLRDLDGDGRSDETTTLAAGWGHTDDYHDWVVGLERDAEANYYIAIPCQQDERTEAAAFLRGKVLQLSPRVATPDAPESFAIRQLTGGHRFPHGIARNRDGQMFVTDNQGNYNPFNELNHIVPGRRYGFINRLEHKPDFQPQLTPPAINIPHPWTRSVNGICFLDTPHTDGGVGFGVGVGFGPFEGHLVGCEYDTRRLIRMSLQRVGDEYQGAAYPFSYDTPVSGPAIPGPIVCSVAPDGDLYVGSLRESGWGGGKNTGEIIRLSMQDVGLPAGIAEIRAARDGFTIEFTQDVQGALATDVSRYRVMSYRRISTPKYGGDDVDRRDERVANVTMSTPNQVHVRLRDTLRSGFVYEFRLQPLVEGEFFPSEGHYSLNRIPRDP